MASEKSDLFSWISALRAGFPKGKAVKGEQMLNKVLRARGEAGPSKAFLSRPTPLTNMEAKPCRRGRKGRPWPGVTAKPSPGERDSRVASEGTSSCCRHDGQDETMATKGKGAVGVTPRRATCPSQCSPLLQKRKQKSSGHPRSFALFHGLKHCFSLCSFIFLPLPWDSPFSHDTMTKKNAHKGLVFKIQSRL